MPTQAKPKMKDLFDSISNPAGGFNTAHSTPSMNLSSLFAGNKGPLFPTAPAGPMSMVPTGAAPAPLAPTTPSAPAFRGSAPVAPAPIAPAPAPAPAGATGAAPAVPPQWIKPDGTFYTPEEVSANIANTLKKGNGTADVGNLAANEFGGGQKTSEQLQTEATQINNARNDIASGANDPYKVAADSGVAYTPQELSAIEQAYAGNYTPALTTAMSKLAAAQTAEAEAAKQKREDSGAERDFKNDLQKLAVSNDYDLEKMAKSHEYDVMLLQAKAAADKAATQGAISPYSDERSTRTVQSVDELLPQVDANPGIFGRSAAAPIPDFLRTQDFLNFRTQLDTLKASIAFNELTAMREASKTGGALGNVSNIELNLLESSLAGLNMSQSPENFKEQLKKVRGSVNRWRIAQGAQPLEGNTAKTGVTVDSPDGPVIITD